MSDAAQPSVGPDQAGSSDVSAAENSAPSSVPRPLVLLMDDDDDARTIYKDMLRFSGFEDVRFTRFRTPYDRKVGGPLVGLLPASLGWFVGMHTLGLPKSY